MAAGCIYLYIKEVEYDLIKKLIFCKDVCEISHLQLINVIRN